MRRINNLKNHFENIVMTFNETNAYKILQYLKEINSIYFWFLKQCQGLTKIFSTDSRNKDNGKIRRLTSLSGYSGGRRHG